MMIQLLSLVLFGEGMVALLLVVKIGPLRELVMNGLDQVRMRSTSVLTIGGTMSLIMFLKLFSVVKIHNKGAKVGTMTPMDQVLWRTHLLEASLMGFSLYLGFLIERMHHHLRILIGFRSKVGVERQEVERLEKDKLQLKEKEERASEEIKQLQKEISNLTENFEKLKAGSDEKDKRVETAEDYVASLQKQSADLLLEYDRLLEENQSLQTQALGYKS